MRLNHTKKILFALSFVVCSSLQSLMAQNFTDILKAPEVEAEAYLGAYIEPAMLSLANGMAGGWYNTAKTHKSLGFDLTFTVNVANIPTPDRKFIFNSAELGFENLVGNEGAEYPTIVGGTTSNTLELVGQYDAPDGNTYTYIGIPEFVAPEGLDVSDLPMAGVPAPMIQLGIGIIKNTDIKIRFGKYSNTSDGVDYGLSLFGIGVMHDFKQWIPGIKHVPIDLAIFVGYSKIKTTFGFDEQVAGDFSAVGEGILSANNTTVQALVSKKLSILTLYGGFGYNFVSSSFKIEGTIVNHRLLDADTGEPYTVTDPVDLTYDGGSTLRGTLGMRLKLAIVTLHADYTFQKYNMLSVGLGFSFR